MMQIYLSHEAEVKKWLSPTLPMIRMTTYCLLVFIWDVLIYCLSRLVIGTYSMVMGCLVMGRLVMGRLVMGRLVMGRFVKLGVHRGYPPYF